MPRILRKTLIAVQLPLLLATAFFSLLLRGQPAAAAETPKEDKSAQRRPVSVIWDFKIPMRDGIRLSGTVYRAADQKERLPVILTMTPYIAAHEGFQIVLSQSVEKQPAAPAHRFCVRSGMGTKSQHGWSCLERGHRQSAAGNSPHPDGPGARQCSSPPAAEKRNRRTRVVGKLSVRTQPDSVNAHPIVLIARSR